MQAIITKYRGPRARSGSRITAKSDSGQAHVSIDNRLSLDRNHAEAAKALCKKMGWDGVLLGPHGLPDGSRVFVFESDDPDTRHQLDPVELT